MLDLGSPFLCALKKKVPSTPAELAAISGIFMGRKMESMSPL